MSLSKITAIVQRVIELAQRRGSILPEEIKQQVVRAGYPSDLWKRVVRLARPALRREADRYVYAAPGLPRLRPRPRQQRHQEHTVVRALAGLVRATKALDALQDRRAGSRFLFLRQVRVILPPSADGPADLVCLTRDVSRKGIRLISGRPLPSEKLRLIFQLAPDAAWEFSVHILWTAQTGDQLYESGGVFTDVLGTPSANS